MKKRPAEKTKPPELVFLEDHEHRALMSLITQEATVQALQENMIKALYTFLLEAKRAREMWWDKFYEKHNLDRARQWSVSGRVATLVPLPESKPSAARPGESGERG